MATKSISFWFDGELGGDETFGVANNEEFGWFSSMQFCFEAQLAQLFKLIQHVSQWCTCLCIPEVSSCSSAMLTFITSK